LDWEHYQRKCKRTLTYKSDKEKIACSTLEITDELVELLEHYHGSNSERLLKLELGDITYALAILSYHYEVELENLDEPYRPPSKAVSLNMGTNLIDDGLFCAGKIAGIIKKCARDDEWELTDTKNRREMLEYYMSSLYTLIIKFCVSMNFAFSDVLSMNIEKLWDRKERGVINGDGDLR